MSSQTALIQLGMSASNEEKKRRAENNRLCKQSPIKLHGMASDNCIEKPSHIARSMFATSAGMSSLNARA
jgi:hypothetical protein